MTADQKAAAEEAVNTIKKALKETEIIPGLDEKVDYYKAFLATVSGYWDAFSGADNYYQLFAVFLSVLTAYAIAAFLKRKIAYLREAPKTGGKIIALKAFAYQSQKLIPPLLLMLVFYPVLTSVCLIYSEDSFIIEAFKRVTIVWILWEALRSYVAGPLIRMLGQWMLAPAALLQLFGLFGPAVAFMESFSYRIGELEISLYTLVKGFFLFGVVIWLGGFLSETLTGKIRRNRNISPSVRELLVKFFDIGLYLILGIFTLNLIGIDLTALAVFSGALGVGIGFGLQKIASNFISGVIMLTEGSVAIGHLVRMDSGLLGYVRRLGARAAIVETFDGQEVIVPNEDFITSRVSNLTYSANYARIDLSFGVSYNADPHRVKEIVLTAIRKYEGLSKREGLEPICYLRGFGDNSVDFLVTFWIDDVNTGRWTAENDGLFIIWDALKENHIEIPFPQRDVHIRYPNQAAIKV